MATVVSLWVHVLLFRRVGFVYMDHVFHEVSRRRSHQREARPLGGAAADELPTLAALAPLWGTNLRAPVRDVLACTDASGGKRPRAAGVARPRPARWHGGGAPFFEEALPWMGWTQQWPVPSCEGTMRQPKWRMRASSFMRRLKLEAPRAFRRLGATRLERGQRALIGASSSSSFSLSP